MACISPDGKPTESGTRMLRALQGGSKSPEEVAKDTGLPLFRVRSGLRELTQAGFADQKDDKYNLSSKGVGLLDTLST
jgi:DNA-binding IclR family transcriptional regulator